MSILAFKDVYKTYEVEGRTTAVLRGLSLEVKEGEFLSVMGPSGSGKSTLRSTHPASSSRTAST